MSGRVGVAAAVERCVSILDAPLPPSDLQNRRAAQQCADKAAALVQARVEELFRENRRSLVLASLQAIEQVAERERGTTPGEGEADRLRRQKAELEQELAARERALSQLEGLDSRAVSEALLQPGSRLADALTEADHRGGNADGRGARKRPRAEAPVADEDAAAFLRSAVADVGRATSSQ